MVHAFCSADKEMANSPLLSRGLFWVCRERPRHCRPADQRDELASPHIGFPSSGASIVSAEAGTLTGAENHCRGAQPMSLMGHSRRRQPKPCVHALPLLSQKLT